jgi:hypothetical protein
MLQPTLSPRKLLTSLLIALATISSGCEKLDEDEADPGSGGSPSLNLTCSSGSLPTNFQCIKGPTGLSTTTTYKIPEVIGSWNSDDYDFCVTYSSNGTGVIKYKPSSFSPGSTQNIKWGAMVNSKGELLISSVGTVMIVHQSTSSTPVDPQIVGLSFLRSTKQWYGFDLKKVSSCN